MKKYNIMVVDDDVTNLTMARQALSENYLVTPVTSGEKALALLEKVQPNLILLDIDMPGMNGYDTLKAIKQDEKISQIPVIFLTSLEGSGNELIGLELGAVDYLTKPFSPDLLIKRIEMHIDLYNYTYHLQEMVTNKTEIIRELQYAIIHTVTDLIERRDGSTGGHIMRTQQFVKILIEALLEEAHYQEELAQLDCNLVAQASQLHDVGKIGIADAILLKPGKLDTDEFEIMKGHVKIGEEAILNAMSLTQEKQFLEYALVLASYHHEKWDGSGYPRKLKGEDIPLLGRIMAVADVYDALASKRPYKAPMPYETVMDILENDNGHHFDPTIIGVFSKIKDRFWAISQRYD